ncbi:TPA: hypothetical protein I3317_000984 [Enterobacter cloacae subsp. cloacae]|nr:hypothetical protein [Enterobacter cloacae subsp. cloacae]
MSTITKEQLRERAREKVKSLEFAVTQTAFADSRAELEEELDLARIALASLEAEPVAYSLIFRNMDGVLNDYVNANTTFSTIEKAQAYGRGGNYVRQNDGSLQWVSDPSLDPVVVPLFTAPPAPVSVHEAAPVAYIFKHPAGRLFWSLTDESNKGQSDVMPVYSAPVPAFVPPAIEPDYEVIKGILPTANPDEYACCIAADMWNACRAAMLQGAEFVKEANKLPEGWVMVPKEPTEVMFNAGKLAAGPTKQPDTASLVYKAMIDSSPDYKVGRETAFTGYEVQENVKDYVRRKIHTAFDVEKAVLWILKNSKYPEPDLWVFDIKVQFVDGPVISTDKSVTVVHSTLCKCSPPVGNVQFIECTLPAEWEGKVNAIDCVFKAAPQQEVSQALAKGMERYGDAMQELAKKEVK